MTHYPKPLMFVWLAILLLQAGCVSNLFYHPTRLVYQTPAQQGLRYEEILFESGDGTLLHGWFVPAVGKAEGTVIHFHGNAQNMTAHFSFVDWLPAKGFNVFVFDYRGYGLSAGRPGRRGLYEDGLAAIHYVGQRPEVDKNRICLLGQSLGAADAACCLATRHPPGIKAIAMESSFYSYRSIVRDKMGQIPVVSLLKWPLSFLLVSNRYSPGPVMDRISPIPVLIIHGTRDRIVLYYHARKLYEQAQEPKELWTIPNGPHTGAFPDPHSPYREKLVDFFKAALSESAASSAHKK